MPGLFLYVDAFKIILFPKRLLLEQPYSILKTLIPNQGTVGVIPNLYLTYT